MDSVRAAVPMQMESRGGIHAVVREQQPDAFPLADCEYKDPTQTLPKPAPHYSEIKHSQVHELVGGDISVADATGRVRYYVCVVESGQARSERLH